MGSEKKGWHDPRDLIDRADKTPTPFGTATFIGLRGLDVFMQYGILGAGLGSGILSRLGLPILSQGPAAQTGTFFDGLNLSPYRLALVGMSAGSFIKQAFWRILCAGEPMSPSVASLISFFNTICNSANSFLFICASTSAAKYVGEGPESSKFPAAPLIVGSSLYVSGLLIETVSEIQRTRFKNKEENKGKPYGGGIWAWSRHPNYLGYTMWRAGYALAAGGWLAGGLVAAAFSYDFITRAIPVLEGYCENRYADMWHDYQART